MPKPRKKDTRQPKPTLHILCEGKKTEPNYLQGFLDTFHPGNKLLNLVKIENTKKNTPIALVNEAVKKKEEKEIPKKDEETSPIDIFWVVYDRESTTKYPDKLHTEAYQIAKQHNIEIALSNVCFEVWIVLHFVGSSSYYKNCDELLKLSPLKNELKKLGIKKYNKADRNLFSVLSDKIAIARQRAESMNKATINSSPKDKNKPYQWNPYTDVHKLLDAIDQFVKDWE